MVIGILAFTCKDEERLAKDQTDKAINLSVEIYFWQVNRPLAKVVIASSSDLPVQRLS